jgi:hypothetical protein
LRCKSPLKKGQYKRVENGVVCHGRRNEATCRQRVLSEELGIDLFIRYPRERLVFEMDPRPANAKKNWRSIATDDERVMAGWIYFSWCYPIGLAYAVQIDEDDDIMKERGAIVVMTHERLAKIIGIPRQSVTRATGRLAARKRLVVDDGRVYPVGKPQITLAEREAANEADVDALGEAPNTIPRKYRHLLNDLLGDVEDEGIRTDALDEVLGLCTRYNEEHKGIRSTRDLGIEQVCTRIASLLSRPLTFKTSSSLTNIPSPIKALPPGEAGEKRNDDDALKEQYVGATAPAADAELRKALYNAGQGKGKLAKLPSKPERPLLLIQTAMEKWVGPHLVDLVIPAAIWQDATDHGWSAIEVCGLIDDRGLFAQKKRNPPKFLQVAVTEFLRTPGALEKIRAKLAATEVERVAFERREEERATARSVAELQDAAFTARWEGMSAEEREQRMQAALKQLVAEAKASGKPRGRMSDWDAWQLLTKEQKRNRAEIRAQHDLRDEIERGIGAGTE